MKNPNRVEFRDLLDGERFYLMPTDPESPSLVWVKRDGFARPEIGGHAQAVRDVRQVWRVTP